MQRVKRKTGGELSGAKAKRVKKARAAPHASEIPDEKMNGLADMSVDEFLDGGFLKSNTPAEAPNGLTKKKPKRGAQKSAFAEAVASEPVKKAKRKAHAAEVADGDPQPKGEKKSTRSETEQHKAQLEALREQDPDFYKYLQQADSELLEFGLGEDGDQAADGEPSDPSDDGNDSEDEEAQQEAFGRKDAARAAPKGAVKGSILTLEMVEKWCKDAKESTSAGALDRLMKAYRIACHLGDEEEDLDATMKIVSSAVFNKILIFVIKEADGLIRKHLSLPRRQLTANEVRKAARWRKFEHLVKSFLGNSLHLLAEQTDTAMIVFMLKHLRQSAAFLVASDRLQQRYLKHLLQIFGQAESAARLQAILFVREMAITLPPPMLSLVMKGVYRSFVVNTKFMSPATLAHINFMATCVTEIFGLDAAAAYEHAFTYIKQLAVLLRTAMDAKTKDAFREVYCWQTVSSLELWAKLLSTHADNEVLRPLAYPVAQLLTGTIRLVPTARYFPLRLRLVRALNGLARGVGQFIPVAPLLLEALQWKGLHTAVKEGGRPPNAAAPLLRAGKQLLDTAAYQQALVEEVLLLLAEHLAQWCTSPAFPEMAHIILLQLRKMAKDSKVWKFRTTAQGLMAAIQSNAEYVVRARNSLECSPKDSAALASFLATEADRTQAPMHKYAKVLQQKAAKQRSMAEAEEVIVGAEAGDDASSDEELPIAGLMPELRKKAASKRGEAPTKEEAKTAAEAGSDEVSSGDDEDAQDEVKELVFSDSE